VSVDVPASLSGRGGSSQSAVWVAALAVGVVVVWVLESTWVAVSASLSISASAIPTPRPSSNPSLYPSSRAVVSSCSTSSWLYVNCDVSVVAFRGHLAPKANEKSFQVLFSCVPKFPHHWSASEPDFKCISKMCSFSASDVSVLERNSCSNARSRSCWSSCS
jgi:hypothetical protein